MVCMENSAARNLRRFSDRNGNDRGSAGSTISRPRIREFLGHPRCRGNLLTGSGKLSRPSATNNKTGPHKFRDALLARPRYDRIEINSDTPRDWSRAWSRARAEGEGGGEGENAIGCIKNRYDLAKRRSMPS